MKVSLYRIIMVLFGAAAIVAVVLFYLPNFSYSPDKTVNDLIGGIAIRCPASIFLIMSAIEGADARLLFPDLRAVGRNLLLALPCFAVAAVNFPFSALLSGNASVTRPELIWLFVLSCLFIGVSEEVFFRAMLQPIFLRKFKNVRFGLIVSVLLTSALFSLWHFFNVFESGFGAVMFQVGYTFLLGGMFSVTMLMTKDVWICVIIHALFDFGGALVPTLGSGIAQDSVFWILTVTVGIACGVYIFIQAVIMQRKLGREL